MKIRTIELTEEEARIIRDALSLVILAERNAEHGKNSIREATSERATMAHYMRDTLNLLFRA